MSRGKIIEQFCEQVTDFSSQYGFEGRLTYVMKNMAGEPHIYPQYGDYTESAVFRSYGTHWRRSPFFIKSRKAELESATYSDDFAELKYVKDVIPQSLQIFETYNPGALVRVLALRNDRPGKPRWYILWKGNTSPCPKESRMFEVVAKPVKFTTKIIRLEFNSRLCDYYTEIDAVKLIGEFRPDSPDEDEQMSSSIENVQAILKALSLTQKSSNELALASRQRASSDSETSESTSASAQKLLASAHKAPIDSYNGFFDTLPSELMQIIFSYFDFETRFRIARVCKLFQQHALIDFKPTEIDVQPFWFAVDDCTLGAFIRYFPKDKYSSCDANDCKTSRLGGLKQVNLSWSGWHPTAFANTVFSDFIEVSCTSLHTLSLSSCRFVDSKILTTISSHCALLERLDLSSCKAVSGDAFCCIGNLKRLTTLNLYRTLINSAAVCHICESCDNLQSLNLGCADQISDYDLLLSQICQYRFAENFRAFDFWRARSLTEKGITLLAQHFPNLEELDIGWTSVDATRLVLVHLAESCPRLRKLFLTTLRTVTTRDLFAFADHLRDLEQLDILGSRFNFEEEANYALSNLLTRCTKLIFLDVSFCNNVGFLLTHNLRARFPRVEIKKSFQSDDRLI